mgnify:CR=1 FL=1
MILKTSEEIEIMAEAGHRLGEILAKLEGEVRPGIATNVLDQKSFRLIQEAGVVRAFQNIVEASDRRKRRAGDFVFREHDHRSQ